MVTINLLPDLILNRRRQARLQRLAFLAVVVWAAAAVLVVVLVVSYDLFQRNQLSSKQSQYNSLNADVNSSDNVTFRATALAVQTSLKDLDQLLNLYRDPRDIMTLTTSLLPKGDILTDVKLGPDGSVVVSAKANSLAEAVKLYYAIRDSKKSAPTNNAYFSNVTWSGFNSDSGAAIPFSVTGVYVVGSGQ